MGRSLKPTTTLFLAALAVTVAIWVMRGIGFLIFIPGLVIWLLLLITISLGVISRLQRTIR